jgi:hypothetical protein
VSEPKRPSTAKPSTRKPKAAAPKQPVQVEVEAEAVMEPEAGPIEDAPFRADRKRVEPETEADIYTLQVFFDQEEGVYRAGFLEFPEFRVSEVSRKDAIYGAEDKLYSHLAALRQSGQPVPQPIRSREFPTHIELPLSQTLFRRLEARRYQERVSLEHLITELLTSSVDRKSDSGDRHQGTGRSGNNRNHSNQSKRPQQQSGRGGGRRSANYHETMDSRENFMEYVRNLEKGGGPGYKKR